jgi:hypothetical protein
MDLYTEIMVGCELSPAWTPSTRQFDRDKEGKKFENKPPRRETELEVSIRRKGVIAARIIMKTKGCTFDADGNPKFYGGRGPKYNPCRLWGVSDGERWIYTCEKIDELMLTRIQQGAGCQRQFIQEVIAELNWLGVPTDIRCGGKIDFEYWHGLRGIAIPPVVRALYDLFWDAAEHHVRGEEFEELDNIANARADGMYRLWLEKGATFLSTGGMTTRRKVATVIGQTCVKCGVQISGVK